MKKIDIIVKLEAINSLNAKEKSEALANFIEELRPKSVASNVKQVKMIRVFTKELDKNVKMPAQMETIYNYLKSFGENAEISLTELKEDITENVKLVEELKTKQNPFLIYNFYQKRLEDLGLILRFTLEVA